MATVGAIESTPTEAHRADLSPMAAWAAACLRFTLATWWIVHWWFKVGVAGILATEIFFSHYGLPAWLVWLDVSFEVVVALCLIVGLYVPLVCIVSLPILIAGVIIYHTNGFYFPGGGIELPILWGIVQIVQAMLGPGRFRITTPSWLRRVPQSRALAP